jgi:ABC-type sugar transport system ATPase subunit
LHSHLERSAPALCAVAARAVTKRFPGVLALDSVDFDVLTGEVHALVGENGAGKSTLIKMLTGAERPDTGVVTIFGDESSAADAHTRLTAGVAAIYQELTIVPEMSAAANVFLRSPPGAGPFVLRRRMRQAFADLASRLGLGIDPDAPAGRLSIADRQMIEIMRALATHCRVLIMDEPTATLGPLERSKLFEVVRDLRRSGTAIIYISHDLDEVLEISDRISVMRNGALIETGLREHWTKDRMVRAMVGTVRAPAARETAAGRGKEILAVTGLTVPGRITDVSFSIHAGEILGLAGLVGSGRTEILRALAGAEPGATARFEMDGKAGPLPSSVRNAVVRGIVLVPEERKAQGFVPLLSGWRNVMLTDLPRASIAGFVRDAAANELATETMRPLGFATRRLHQPVRDLSGGNQQKLVIGKWLHRRPRVLLLDEPTRGVDIAAKAEIYESIRRLADDGLAVILVSSELQEVVEQSDRVLVLGGARIVAQLNRGEATVERLLSKIFAVEGTA